MNGSSAHEREQKKDARVWESALTAREVQAAQLIQDQKRTQREAYQTFDRAAPRQQQQPSITIRSQRTQRGAYQTFDRVRSQRSGVSVMNSVLRNTSGRQSVVLRYKLDAAEREKQRRLLEEEQLEKMQRENWNRILYLVCKLQSFYRGRLERLRLQILDRSASQIQTCHRRWTAINMFSKSKAAQAHLRYFFSTYIMRKKDDHQRKRRRTRWSAFVKVVEDATEQKRKKEQSEIIKSSATIAMKASLYAHKITEDVKAIEVHIRNVAHELACSVALQADAFACMMLLSGKQAVQTAFCVRRLRTCIKVASSVAASAAVAATTAASTANLEAAIVASRFAVFISRAAVEACSHILKSSEKEVEKCVFRSQHRQAWSNLAAISAGIIYDGGIL